MRCFDSRLLLKLSKFWDDGYSSLSADGNAHFSDKQKNAVTKETQSVPVENGASSSPQHRSLLADVHNFVTALLGIQQLACLKVVKRQLSETQAPGRQLP